MRQHPKLAQVVERCAHPLFLAGALSLWWTMGRGDGAMLAALALSLVAMELLERVVPAVPRWRQSPGEKMRLLGVYILSLVVSGLVLASYEAVLVPLLRQVRAAIGGPLWPSDWPVLAQVVLLFLAGDFIYYWIHRAIHSSAVFWRISGHGFHHGFHNLHAINVGTNHPFEVVYLVLPIVLVGATFGTPAEATTGAGVLAIVNGTLAHANVRMETPVFSWFVTSSNQHRRHHSVVFEESNTNFACNAIVFDRLFGTYGDGEVRETGIGPRQPALWQMFLLPFREPADADTISSRSNR